MKKNSLKTKLPYLSFLLFLFVVDMVMAQAIYEDERYVPETDQLVLKKLDQWQDLKFGLLMHWGPYSQWGIVESWSICPEEYGWCERKKGSNPNNYFEYVKEYENLQTTFDPVKFNPEKWAKAAKKAGMKYVVFTTKHHDGFSMFDSKYTDYKSTGPKTPFNKNPRANITKEIFDAFRGEGLWTGAYFSKPDWHSPYYWDPYYPPRDRNVNYEPEANPEKWNKFVEFTHNQILELLTDYGKVDILWLDGGWVAKTPKSQITSWYDAQLKNNDNGYLKHRIVNQDIRMDELVTKAREKQPGLIVVDRAVHGKNQNYLTPENRVPEKPLPYPWESCIIAGGGWSYTFNANYMSTNKAVHTLVDIVAKGGNLLLNIAPSPEGELDEEAYRLLEGIGDWMNVNGEAIYGTEAMAPYKYGNVCVTSTPDGNIYLIYLMDEEETSLPSTVAFEGLPIKKGNKASILGVDGNIKWAKNDERLTFEIPDSAKRKLQGTPAFVIKIK
ncbi:alpha-L-fucosidase [Allomuricauda sp. SCSIO 65647]|uniref:alpha-L-fucosidase n=1 Tax=Allomuricauda sp. SCSIO 65647 TaxID=2908843 RepID=UPI001F259207|nr:alpha-L-fucosidase [Muricauda sp. SCSIO 65647]UJH68778.1 alpha-L-fucosidase [Muricauda sp. SCSIO 65647]